MLVMRLAREKVSATSWLLQVVRLTEYLHRGESKDGLLHHGFVDKNTTRNHHGFVDNKVQNIPDICHGRHGRRPCKFFLAGVNFYRFNAKNWHFRQILREKVAFFTDLMRKIGIFHRFYAKKWRFLQI